MVRIFCANTGTYQEFVEGTTLQEMSEKFEFDKPYRILSAKVNYVSEGLKFRVFNNRDVEFLDYTSYCGRRTYTRSLRFILSKALSDCFPGAKVSMRRPISKGYYCIVDKPDGAQLTQDDIARIDARMREIVAADMPFRRVEVHTEEAVEMFSNRGDYDTAKLLESTGSVYTIYYKLEDTPDYYCGPLVPSTSYIQTWQIIPYRNGFILRIPNRHSPDQLAPYVDQPKTFDVLAEDVKWNKIMGLSSVGDVNEACINGQASDLIQVAEALQEKKIVQISEEIEKRYFAQNPIRVILITGPSSSGKTTFSKRLSIQLKACGLHPVSFSTDDYFVNRVETPKLPDGSYDFDNFDTVDHDALQSDLVRLLNGEAVQVPEYNFVTGIREYNGKTLQLGPGVVLLLEGIHALNPALTDKISDDLKFKIFINTVTSIPLDNHNSIPTSDNRLLRRIVRDYNKGAFGVCNTISNWPNVRRAEVKWIYPYQESADILFNSSYLVEFAVLKSHAEAILREVPRNCKEFSEAHRLLKFLRFFVPVSDKEIPSTSLIRGFIGGSSL